jgi:hypothetical protein
MAELHPMANFENDPFAESRQALSIISIIISGVCRVMITAILIRTMTFVNMETAKLPDSETIRSSNHELATYFLGFFKENGDRRPSSSRE